MSFEEQATVPIKPVSRLDQVDREWMIRGAWSLAARHHKRNVPLWSFVRMVCCVGAGSGQQICRELGWNPDAMAHEELPPTRTH